ncbi:hypothetical protein ACFVWN_25735 [Nocardiopsis flavescens]|uniref:hypothetical protein n=1 Tax=Nocardiopsis flavescens TaxID=758803 RepID=UPI003649F075
MDGERDRRARAAGAEINARLREERRRLLRRRIVFWAWSTLALTLLGVVAGLVLDGVDGALAVGPWALLAALVIAGINLGFEVYLRGDV